MIFYSLLVKSKAAPAAVLFTAILPELQLLVSFKLATFPFNS